MKMLMLVLLFLLVSCGKDDKTPTDQVTRQDNVEEQEPTTVEWRLATNKTTFPKYASVSIDGIEIFNDCLTKIEYPFTIDREEGVVLYSEDYKEKLEESTLSVKVTDLGKDCKGTETYYYFADQTFTIEESNNIYIKID